MTAAKWLSLGTVNVYSEHPHYSGPTDVWKIFSVSLIPNSEMMVGIRRGSPG